MANWLADSFGVVYTGILPITKNEAGLATVMGHEIAHAVARHGNERMSQHMNHYISSSHHLHMNHYIA